MLGFDGADERVLGQSRGGDRRAVARVAVGFGQLFRLATKDRATRRERELRAFGRLLRLGQVTSLRDFPLPRVRFVLLSVVEARAETLRARAPANRLGLRDS